MESKIVLRKVADLRADPEQPRKKFDKEAIKNLSNTIKSQGLINPIEIDKKNIIITGEMRWRACKLAYPNGEEIECKLLTKIEDWERKERQLIENLHHNILESKEIENSIKKLWETQKYETKTKMGKIIGIDNARINHILRAYKTRQELEKEKIDAAQLSTRTLEDIGRLETKEDRKKMAQKVVKKEIKPSEVRNIVKTIKNIEEKAPELKEEILKPEVKITEEKLEEIKEIAKFPEPEQRKKMIDYIKESKDLDKKIIKEQKEIALGKKEPPTIIINKDRNAIEIYSKLAKKIYSKFRKGLINRFNEPTKQEIHKIIKNITNYLIKEFSEVTKVYEI